MASVPTIVFAVLVGVAGGLVVIGFVAWTVLGARLGGVTLMEGYLGCCLGEGAHQHEVLILLRNIHIVTCIVKLAQIS